MTLNLLAGSTSAQIPMVNTYSLSSADRPAFDATKGRGYVSTPGGNEAAFSVYAAPGDYRVTATVGPGLTSLWAEDRRLVTPPVHVPPGETRQVSFLVNVRDAHLSASEQDAIAAPKVGLRGDEAIGRNWDDRLTVSASGSAALQTLSIEPVQVRRLLLAGDSTVADQAGADYASWGQMLPRFLSGDIAVANHARGGETMKSFLTSLRWDKVLSETRPGDIVLIQFGHNDQKKQWPRTYLDATHGYPAYLTAFVADVRQRGAHPVLVTPVARRFFDGEKVRNTHEGYDQAVRDTAGRLGVPLIDLTPQTAAFYESLGPERSALAFANGGQDKTHHNAYGAWIIAAIVAKELAALNLGLVAEVPDSTPTAEAFEITPDLWPLMRTPDAPKHTAEPMPIK